MKTETIRVIVINPLLETIEAVDMPNDFETMKSDYIKCDLAEPIDLGSGVDAWIDEEGILCDWDEQGFTKFSNHLTLAGNIVLAGRDKENDLADIPAEITVELVSLMCDFIPPREVKIPGTTITTMNPDGTMNVMNVGPKELTYADH